MAITLHNVKLSDHIIWEDEFKHSPVLQEVEVTLAGNMVFWDGIIAAGRRITLMAKNDQGWLTGQQVKALEILSNNPGAVYQLTVGSQTFAVKFAHHEPPAFDYTPLTPQIDAPNENYYTGVIKLITI